MTLRALITKDAIARQQLREALELGSAQLADKSRELREAFLAKQEQKYESEKIDAIAYAAELYRNGTISGDSAMKLIREILSEQNKDSKELNKD